MHTEQSNAYKTIRKVTIKECEWLDKAIPKGKIIYAYTGHTYGCISSKGKSFSFIYGELPFFELPLDSFEKIN